MDNSSLNKLADFWSYTVSHKFSKMEPDDFRQFAQSADDFYELYCRFDSLRQKRDAGFEINVPYFECLTKKLKKQSSRFSSYLDCEELHLKYVSAIGSPCKGLDEVVVCYHVKVEQLAVCVFYTIGVSGAFVNSSASPMCGHKVEGDAWDYYFERTPCAVV